MLMGLSGHFGRHCSRKLISKRRELCGQNVYGKAGNKSTRWVYLFDFGCEMGMGENSESENVSASVFEAKPRGETVKMPNASASLNKNRWLYLWVGRGASHSCMDLWKVTSYVLLKISFRLEMASNNIAKIFKNPALLALGVALGGSKPRHKTTNQWTKTLLYEEIKNASWVAKISLAHSLPRACLDRIEIENALIVTLNGLLLKAFGPVT